MMLNYLRLQFPVAVGWILIDRLFQGLQKICIALPGILLVVPPVMTGTLGDSHCPKTGVEPIHFHVL